MRISPFQNAQTATTSSSNTRTLSPEQSEPNIQVAELLPRRHRKRHASLIKLTDECLAAINEAIRKEWRIRITVAKENILIHVGNGTATPTIFQCTQQTLPGTVEAIYREPSASNAYQTVSSLNTKFVVNATEKTFAETREKAQKLAEEDAKKMVKDMTVKKDPMAKYRGAKNGMFKPSSFTPSTTTIKSNGYTSSPASNAQKRISPPISSTTQQVNRAASPTQLLKGGASTTNTPSKPAAPPLVVQNRHELLKRATRERCLHLLATCKYKTRTELLDRLRFEGAPKNERAEDFLNSAETIIKEISQFDNSLDALFVKPKFHSEINLRWPWLLSSEREQLRRLIKPAQSAPEESTSIAPMRRSGNDRQLKPQDKDQNHTSTTKQNDRPTAPSVIKPQESKTAPIPTKSDDRQVVPPKLLKQNGKDHHSTVPKINKPPKQQEQPVPTKTTKPINWQPASLVTKPTAPEQQRIAQKTVPKSTIEPSKNGISKENSVAPLKRSPMISTPSSVASNESLPSRKRPVQPSPDQVDVAQKRPRVHSVNGKIKESPAKTNGNYLEPMDVTENGAKRRISNASDIGRPVKPSVKESPAVSNLELMENGRRRISNASDIGRPVKLLGVKTEVPKVSPMNGTLEPMESGRRRISNASDIGRPIKPKIKESPVNGNLELMENGRRRISNASDIGRPVNPKIKESPISSNGNIIKTLEPMETNERRASNASDIGKPVKTLAKTWPSTNELEKQFPAVCDSKQAIRYHEMFVSEYPKYRQYHDELTNVSTKFKELKTRFDRVEPDSSKQKEILRRIQDTYNRYQTDERYAETRRRHSQLHARLSLLKRRVADWEKRLINGSSKSQPQLNRVDLSPMAQPNSRLTNRYRRERSASPGGSTTYSSTSAASTTSVESLCSASHLYDEMALF